MEETEISLSNCLQVTGRVRTQSGFSSDRGVTRAVGVNVSFTEGSGPVVTLFSLLPGLR